ncbi:FAD:protein FMN transferase [Vibrio metschnikovii]
MTRCQRTVKILNSVALINIKVASLFQVSEQTATVVKEAIRLNALTLGALDVTVGPLVNLWGFGPEARSRYST